MAQLFHVAMAFFCVLIVLPCCCEGHEAEADVDDSQSDHRLDSKGDHLYDEVIGKYNKYVLPVESAKDNVAVTILLRLVSLTDIDERNQIMTTTVWVKHDWHDPGLVWDPDHFGNITKFQLPSEDLWVPDTILYNNADGDYQITIKTKATINHDGHILWVPPAIYKSFCDIDVRYFPYDEQVCELKFGPWSYDISKVDYKLFDPKTKTNYKDFLEEAADLEEYSSRESVEWDILQINGKRTVWRYPCCPEEYVDVTYQFHLRRRTLFYTINLVIPVLLISFLTVFVFYLPPESWEKITLSISILVSLVFFILMLYELIPPTSTELPLMSKYLLFTIIVVTLSTIVSIFTLTIFFHHSSNEMPNWVRRVFLVFLPKVLLFEIPPRQTLENIGMRKRMMANLFGPNVKFNFDDNDNYNSDDDAGKSSPLYQIVPPSPHFPAQGRNRRRFDRAGYSRYGYIVDRHAHYENVIIDWSSPRRRQSGGEQQLLVAATEDDIKQALMDVQLMANTLRERNEERRKQKEWETVANVLDRLFLYVFAVAVVIGTIPILASAPSLYDTTPAVNLTKKET